VDNKEQVDDLMRHIHEVEVPRMDRFLDRVVDKIYETEGRHDMDERLTTFVTTDGVKLRLKSVRKISVDRRQQKVEAELRAQGLPIDVPTRTTVALGGKGDTEIIPLSAKTLVMRDDPDGTARNEALWRAHEDALLKLSELQKEEMVITMLALGVEIDGGVPPVEEWSDQLDYIGVEMPAHVLDQKAYYLLFCVLSDVDLNILLSQIQMLGAGKAVTGEQIAEFQDAIQSQMGEAINSLVESAKDRLTKGIVASTPKVPGITDGEGVEDKIA